MTDKVIEEKEEEEEFIFHTNKTSCITNMSKH